MSLRVSRFMVFVALLFISFPNIGQGQKPRVFRGDFVRITTGSDSTHSGYLWGFDSGNVVLQQHRVSTLATPYRIPSASVRMLEKLSRSGGPTKHVQVYGMGGFAVGALVGYAAGINKGFAFVWTTPAAGAIGAFAGVLYARSKKPYEWHAVSDWPRN